jgi:nitronate monooxygenase
LEVGLWLIALALTDGAPMAGSQSTPALVAALANAGGLGFLAGAMVSPETAGDAIVAIRGLTSEGIGVNLFVLQSRWASLRQYCAFAA